MLSLVMYSLDFENTSEIYPHFSARVIPQNFKNIIREP